MMVKVKGAQTALRKVRVACRKAWRALPPKRRNVTNLLRCYHTGRLKP